MKYEEGIPHKKLTSKNPALLELMLIAQRRNKIKEAEKLFSVKKRKQKTENRNTDLKKEIQI